jgi:hypothetical protein
LLWNNKIFEWRQICEFRTPPYVTGTAVNKNIEKCRLLPITPFKH